MDLLLFRSKEFVRLKSVASIMFFFSLSGVITAAYSNDSP